MANMQDVKCLDCLQAQRVEYDTIHVGSSIPCFCAYCGSPNIIREKIDSYWYELAESLGFPKGAKSADLIHSLYRLWEPTEYPRFRQFVESATSKGE